MTALIFAMALFATIPKVDRRTWLYDAPFYGSSCTRCLDGLGAYGHACGSENIPFADRFSVRGGLVSSHISCKVWVRPNNHFNGG